MVSVSIRAGNSFPPSNAPLLQSRAEELKTLRQLFLVMWSIVRTPLTSLQHAEAAAAINRINAATINTNCTKRLRAHSLMYLSDSPRTSMGVLAICGHFPH